MPMMVVMAGVDKHENTSIHDGSAVALFAGDFFGEL